MTVNILNLLRGNCNRLLFNVGVYEVIKCLHFNERTINLLNVQQLNPLDQNLSKKYRPKKLNIIFCIDSSSFRLIIHSFLDI